MQLVVFVVIETQMQISLGVRKLFEIIDSDLINSGFQFPLGENNLNE